MVKLVVYKYTPWYFVVHDVNFCSEKYIATQSKIYFVTDVINMRAPWKFVVQANCKVVMFFHNI